MQTFITTALHVVEYWKGERERDVTIAVVVVGVAAEGQEVAP